MIQMTRSLRIRSALTVLLKLSLCAFAAVSAQGAETVHTLANADLSRSLQQAHDTQGDVLATLQALAAERRRTLSITEVIDGFEVIYRMQTAVTDNIRTARTKLLLQTGEEHAAARKATIEDLTRQERQVSTALENWLNGFDLLAQDETATRVLKALHAAVTASSVSGLINETIRHLGEEHVSEALTSAEGTSTEIARLLQLMHAAADDPDRWKAAQLRALDEIIQKESTLKKKVDNNIGASDWRQLRREQSDIREQTLLLTFDETGMPREALTETRHAHDEMKSAEASLLKKNQDEVATHVAEAIASLKRAVELMEQAESANLSAMGMPPALENDKPDKSGGMMAMAGQGGEGLDISGFAMIAADIAQVAKLVERQTQLYQDTIGDGSVRVATGRQTSYAAKIPQLAARIERYHVDAASVLREARKHMGDSLERLRADDREGSAPHQLDAIAKLQVTEKQLRDFWDELMESIQLISKAVEGSPHGASASEEEKAKEDLLMILMREIVRVGRMVKDLKIQMARTESWLKATPETIDKNAVAKAAEEHRVLKETGLDIVEKLMPLGGEAGTMTIAVMEGSQWIDGASHMLDENNYAKAYERQQAAMKFLTEAWSTIAMSMSTLNEGKESDEKKPNSESGDAKVNDGSGDAGGGAQETQKGEPWFWSLPPRMREAVQQSQAGELPPKYEPAIRRYYDRLSKGSQGE